MIKSQSSLQPQWAFLFPKRKKLFFCGNRDCGKPNGFSIRSKLKLKPAARRNVGVCVGNLRFSIFRRTDPQSPLEPVCGQRCGRRRFCPHPKRCGQGLRTGATSIACPHSARRRDVPFQTPELRQSPLRRSRTNSPPRLSINVSDRTDRQPARRRRRSRRGIIFLAAQAAPGRKCSTPHR